MNVKVEEKEIEWQMSCLNEMNVELRKWLSRLNKTNVEVENKCQGWIKGILNMKNEGRM